MLGRREIKRKSKRDKSGSGVCPTKGGALGRTGKYSQTRYATQNEDSVNDIPHIWA